ncbi:MAG: carboxypeptidase regulatory-like domain-containing protein [Deltaproteobacteria bacterium]|nr:carboxypeptidase regulatory-like domain-containing protein [Deltaproteobacteria bacterium]
MWTIRLVVFVSILAAGCGGEDTCDPIANSGCDDNQACERVQDGEPICVAAMVVVGRVFDLETNTGIGGARIVALDANGASMSFVATSAADGTYTLPIPVLRTDGGAPAESFTITLRADASGYLTFPAGIRPALPFDTSGAALTDGRYEITSALTDVALLKLPAGGPAVGTIKGRVAENSTNASVLVVAEAAGLGHTAVAGRDGEYTVFNVPAGAASVQGYARDHNYVANNVDVPAGGTVEADLDVSVDAASTVSGTVSIVNGQLGVGTSVILVVESTFNTAIARGETPPGLRAPEPGAAPTVNGAFSITGVPAGRYVVLAGFENDNLVRDESGIGGTALVSQEVVAGQNVDIATGFKVTGSVDIVGPGATSPEMVTGAPTFTWLDDSSEDRYAITVFDSYGTIVWEAGTPKSVVTLPYAGPTLQAGLYYQFRVASIKDPDTVISRSEDLKGVFFMP